MNTNQLVKHYDKLKATERVALIINANARGDELEANRLTHTAPQVTYSMGHHFWLADRLHSIGLVHLLGLVDMAGLYQRFFAMTDSSEDDERVDRLIDMAKFTGYLLLVKLNGWRLFANRQGFDPDSIFRHLPGWNAVQDAEKLAVNWSFTKEEADQWKRKRKEDDAGIFTAEDVANSLEACFRGDSEEDEFDIDFE